MTTSHRDVSVSQKEISNGGFDEEESDKIPPPMDVITKLCVLTNYDSALGNHYISQVAIGVIQRQSSGIVTIFLCQFILH